MLKKATTSEVSCVFLGHRIFTPATRIHCPELLNIWWMPNSKSVAGVWHCYNKGRLGPTGFGIHHRLENCVAKSSSFYLWWKNKYNDAIYFNCMNFTFIFGLSQSCIWYLSFKVPNHLIVDSFRQYGRKLLQIFHAFSSKWAKLNAKYGDKNSTISGLTDLNQPSDYKQLTDWLTYELAWKNTI